MTDFPQPNLTQIELCVMKHPHQRSSKSSKPCGDPDCIVRWFNILDVIQNHKRLRAENAKLRKQITDSPLRAPQMSEQLHTCSYHCDRPECVRGQRDRLVNLNEVLGAELRSTHDRLQAAYAAWKTARRWVADHYGELSTIASMMDANDPRKATP